MPVRIISELSFQKNASLERTENFLQRQPLGGTERRSKHGLDGGHGLGTSRCFLLAQLCQLGSLAAPIGRVVHPAYEAICLESIDKRRHVGRDTLLLLRQLAKRHRLTAFSQLRKHVVLGRGQADSLQRLLEPAELSSASLEKHEEDRVPASCIIHMCTLHKIRVFGNPRLNAGNNANSGGWPLVDDELENVGPSVVADGVEVELPADDIPEVDVG